MSRNASNIWTKLPADWSDLLADELQKPYTKELSEKVNEAYQNKDIFPPQEALFAAFEFCKLKDIKVVIIGQDPYHGTGQANGLCFSVSEGQPKPPSLKNIFKELISDIGIQKESGDLSDWAKQGVLLLNTVLTVEAHKANSHKSLGWRKFTRAIIKRLNETQEELVFMLWGGQAKKFEKMLDTSKHLVLTSGHPSPLSANKGHWYGNKHFSKCNTFLSNQGKPTINW